MTTSDRKLWQNIELGRYDDAIAYLDDCSKRTGPASAPDRALRASILLALGRYEEAAASFAEANSIRQEEMPGHGPSYLDEIGAAEWLAGHRDKAVSTWQRAVRGILNRTISYADAAGGVSHGLLLRYAGASLGQPELVEEALRFLANRAKRKAIQNWPGPLALLALSQRGAGDILRDCLCERERASHLVTIRPDLPLPDAAQARRRVEQFERTGSLEIVINVAKDDLALRRTLVQFLFHWAVTARIQDKEEECVQVMKICARLQNPLTDVEWYLARQEAGNITSEPDSSVRWRFPLGKS